MKPRTRSPRGEGASLREDILDAATGLLAENGMESAVSVRAIADRVGVSIPSLYLHFADRQAILDAVCERVWTQLDEAMEKAALDGSSALDALKQRGLAYIRFGLANREHYRIVMMDRRTNVRDEEMLIGSSSFAHLVEAVQACIDDATFPADSDPARLGMELWSAAHGLTSLVIAKPAMVWPDVETLASDLLEALARGISTTPV